jgi:hypothetical protein
MKFVVAVVVAVVLYPWVRMALRHNEEPDG